MNTSLNNNILKKKDTTVLNNEFVETLESEKEILKTYNGNIDSKFFLKKKSEDRLKFYKKSWNTMDLNIDKLVDRRHQTALDKNEMFKQQMILNRRGSYVGSNKLAINSNLMTGKSSHTNLQDNSGDSEMKSGRHSPQKKPETNKIRLIGLQLPQSKKKEELTKILMATSKIMINKAKKHDCLFEQDQKKIEESRDISPEISNLENKKDHKLEHKNFLNRKSQPYDQFKRFNSITFFVKHEEKDHGIKIETLGGVSNRIAVNYVPKQLEKSIEIGNITPSKFSQSPNIHQIGSLSTNNTQKK